MVYSQHTQEKLAELMWQMRDHNLPEEERLRVSNLELPLADLPPHLHAWRQRYVAIAQE